MTATSVRRLIVSVSSLEPALRLYEGVLGLTLERAVGEFAWLRTADGVEVLMHQRPSTPSDSAVALSFSVSDLDDIVNQWLADGGSVVDAPATQSWGERMAVVRDCDGHIVCLVEVERVSEPTSDMR